MRVHLREQYGNHDAWNDCSADIHFWYTGKVCHICGCEIFTDNVKPILQYSEFSEKITNDGYYDRSEISQQCRAYRTLVRQADTNSRAIRDIAVCPICGESLPIGYQIPAGYFGNLEGGFGFYTPTDVNRLFDQLRDTRLKSYRKKADTKLASLLSEYEDREFDDTEYSGSCNVANDTAMLRTYLNHLLKIESNIYSLQIRIGELYNAETMLNCEPSEDIGSVLEKANNKFAQAKAEYDALVEVDISQTVKKEHIQDAPCPRKPNKPAFNLEKPTEPSYGTPGLFNKKKVLAQNDALRQAYLAALNEYEQEYSKFQTTLRDYETAHEQYLVAYDAYTAKCRENREAEQRNYDAALAIATRKHQERLDAAFAVMQNCQIELDAKKAGLKQARCDVLDSEIKSAEALLSDMIVCRKQLYAQNIIYPKYRNFVAIASFNDYLMSGRCDTLTGANGAYDKYEMDCRADLVISKLSEVVSSLDAIKDGQYMLYSQITETNKSLNKLNTTMDNALKELKQIGSTVGTQLESINQNTKNIQQNTKSLNQSASVIAYNTAVTAFYAKKNAELTNALGFMVALK